MAQGTRNQDESSGSRADDHPLKDEVVAFLAEWEGWVFQVNIEVEFDWSASVTDEILAEMEENGTVIRYEIQGTEVVSLPGYAPNLISERS